MSDLSIRILTALIAAPVVLGLTFLGGWPFGVLVLGCALLAQYEVYHLMELGGLQPYKRVGLALGALLALRPFFAPLLLVAVVGVLLLVGLGPFHRKEQRPLANLSTTLFGVVYPTAFFAFLLDLRLARGPAVGNLEAFYLTLTLFLLIWATDTFAYFTGKNLGRHKLAPTISPKKTWEGSVGGALGALAVAAVLKLTLLGFVAWPHLIAVALLCGTVSQLGDLAESKMKRSVGAKDSGTLLPGHGGFLDRFDAMILAAPLVYLYLRYGAGLLA